MKSEYHKIRHGHKKGRPAFFSDGVMYFYDPDDGYSKECARLGAECHAPLVPDYLEESLDEIGEGVFTHTITGRIWEYPRGNAMRRRIALDSAILYESMQPPQTAIEQPADYTI